MSDTPRTDAACARIYFNNNTTMIACDPEVSRQLERELAAIKRLYESLFEDSEKFNHDRIKEGSK